MTARVLIVEDNRTQLQLYVDLVKMFGHSPWGCASRTAAKRLMRDAPPDLVLLDLRLPDGSGWGLYEAMREDPSWKDVPVVIVSGDLHAVSQREDWQQGKLALLMKPFGMRELRSAIEENLMAAQERRRSLISQTG